VAGRPLVGSGDSIKRTVAVAWGEIFGDDAVAVAMIDRLVHYAEILSLKGDSYRLKDRDLGRRPAEQPTD
jgi:hypothetical protein